MRILQIVPVFSDPFGGPVTVVRSISKELAKRHEVTIYTTSALDTKHDSEQREEAVNGYRVYYFNRNFKQLIYSDLLGQMNISLNMRKAVKDHLKEFDIVHIHSWQQFPDILLHHYTKKYHVPFVLQVHGSLPQIGPKMLLKWVYDISFGYRILRDASKVIALSEVEAQQYRSMGVPDEKIAVIPNGIDLSEYAVLPPRGSFKRKFGMKDEEKIVLYLGRLHKIKGIDILVKAFINVIENLDDVRLVIVGPDDGSLYELQTLIKDLGVGNKVIFIGPLYGLDKIEAYADSEVYVLSSRYETFPMTILEAYACGKPIITSNVGGLKDLVINGETGLLIESGNTEQLAKNILHLLNDNGRAEEMGLKGRQLVEEKFAINKVVAKLEKVYLEVI